MNYKFNHGDKFDVPITVVLNNRGKIDLMVEDPAENMRMSEYFMLAYDMAPLLDAFQNLPIKNYVPAPAPLKVGDETHSGLIIAIYNEKAWVVQKETGKPLTFNLRSLTRV
jgi:hypothetical protein